MRRERATGAQRNRMRVAASERVGASRGARHGGGGWQRVLRRGGRYDSTPYVLEQHRGWPQCGAMPPVKGREIRYFMRLAGTQPSTSTSPLPPTPPRPWSRIHIRWPARFLLTPPWPPPALLPECVVLVRLLSAAVATPTTRHSLHAKADHHECTTNLLAVSNSPLFRSAQATAGTAPI